MKILYKACLLFFMVLAMLPGAKITSAQNSKNGYSHTDSAATAGPAEWLANTNKIEIHVKGANIKIKKGNSDTIQMKYYGKASDENYELVTAVNENRYKIKLKYKGSGIAPTVIEGGLIVKIPSDSCRLLEINGRGAGIVLSKIHADINLKTQGCAVAVNNQYSGNQMVIDSSGDAYEIKSVPISADFHLKADGSVVEYTFTKQPHNLKFKLTGGYAELPEGWKRNFSMGLGRPEMLAEVNHGIFELRIGSF